MKAKAIKSLILTSVLAVALAPAAFAGGGGSTYYAKLTAYARPSSGAQGKVYVASQEKAPTRESDFKSEVTGGNVTQSSGGNVSVSAYAKSQPGYRFLGWRTTDSTTGNLSSTLDKYTASYKAATKGKENNATTYNIYAFFEPIVTNSITLKVGDTAKFYYALPRDKTASMSAPVTAVGGVTAVSATSGAQNSSGGAYLLITATKPGVSVVTFRAGNDSMCVNDYDIFRVTVEDGVRLSEIGRYEPEYTLACPCSSISAGNSTWSQDASASNFDITKTGNANGATVTVKPKGVGGNDSSFSGTARFYNTKGSAGSQTGAEYVFKFYTTKPWPVDFCQGDKVQIWYNNATEKNWFLLINGVRYEANTTGGERDAQMHVTLTAQNPTTRCYIIGTADNVAADDAEPDFVVISDGENYYSYRMSVGPERVLSPGMSTTMTCSTVAKNPWQSEVMHNEKVDYTPYIKVTNDGDGAASHSTTATLTGLALADETYVEVWDDLHNQGEVNAQGAVYTLKTKVYGAEMVQVHLSPGAYLDASLGALHPGPDTAYQIRERVLEPGEAAQATKTDRSGAGFQVAAGESVISASFLEGGDSGAAFKVRFAAAPTGFFGQYRVFDIVDTALDEVVAIFLVNVTYNFTMDQGQKAASVFDYPVASPWYCYSSDPAIATITPIYSKIFGVYSAECVARGMGDFMVQSTNATTAAAYWAIAAKVRGVRQLNLDLNVGQAATNVTIELDGDLVASDWTLGTISSPTVSATLQPAADGHSAELTVTPNQKGTALFTVTCGYLTAKVSVYVGELTVEKYRVPGTRQVVYGETADLGADASASDWQATVEDATFVSLVGSTSGTAGELIRFRGENVGETRILVESASMVYIYTVDVLPATLTRPEIVVGVRDSVTNSLSFVDSSKWSQLSAASDDPLAVKVSLDKVNGRFIVTGALDGETIVRITDGNTIWNVPVFVHERDIYKSISLSKGQHSSSSYSYTFDQVLGINVKDPDLVTVTRNGNTVTISPIAIGMAQVDVECFVDGLGESSRLHYLVTIEELPSKQDVWQPKNTENFFDGYLAYRGATDAYEVDGELVLVFSNALEGGEIDIPDGCIAYMDILAVGGGGAGGTVAAFGKGAGGGGAGGFVYSENRRYSAGTLCIAVGKGGVSSTMASAFNEEGGSGGDSVVSNFFGYTYANAVGGGGGAAPAETMNIGKNGGSGGGGAYASRKPGLGGQGFSGQGTGGAQPNELNCGGGGGGAGGNGGADQSRGTGKTSFITGTEVNYAVGGLGGRSDTDEPAQAGQGPGFGGDGGNGGPGGDGADGVVVVRVRDLIKNILVPIPTTNDMVNARFEWANNTTNVAFSYEGRTFRSPSDSHPYSWDDALERVKGTTEVVCEYGGDGGTNKVGVGYYNFSLQLKKGFAWDDGTEFGSTEAMTYQWVVTEDLANTDARMEVFKEIIWDSPTSATVRVSAETSPESSGGGTPNVLFLGTLCNGHGMDLDVVNESLRTIASVANVDYFLYSAGTRGESNDKPYKEGHFDVGETNKINLSLSFEAPRHYAMLLFYKRLYAQLIDPATRKNYDYIVFEFDGSRLSDSYTTQYIYEGQVSAAVKKFYDNDSVIWIVDDCNADVDSNGKYVNNEPFKDYWRPNTYWYNNYHNNMKETQFRGLVGLFDPAHYSTNGTFATLSVTSTTWNKSWSTSYGGRNDGTVYAADRWDLQATYNSVADVKDLLSSVIKVKPFNLSYADKICGPEQGLSIGGVTVQGCTNQEEGVWFDIITWDAATSSTTFSEAATEYGIPGASMSVDLTNNRVESTVSNVAMQVFLRFDTHILDNGDFCTDVGAEYNQQTGKFEKNPNDGPVSIAMVDDNGGESGAGGEAETSIPLRYTAHQVFAHVVNGQAFVNGHNEAKRSCSEGVDVTVNYRGYGGYELAALKIDENTIDLRTADSQYLYSCVFDNITAPHDVWITFDRFAGDIETSPVETNYDGRAHLYDVRLVDWSTNYDVEVRYSLDEDADEADFMTAEEFCQYYSTNKTVDITKVGTYTIYFRVFAFQPGYGETLNDPGWIWVQTDVAGYNTVTIAPPRLVVTPKYVYFPYNTYEYPKDASFSDGIPFTVTGFVDGEDLSSIDTTGWGVGSVYHKGSDVGQYETYVTGIADGDQCGNYTVALRSGVLDVVQKSIIIGGVQQASFLDPEDPLVDTGVDRVEKPYDGLDTNLVVEVMRQGDETYAIQYCVGDSRPGASAVWQTAVPRFNHAGTNKVWYWVAETKAGSLTANLIPVTNYQYVVITPQELKLRSASAEKRYDGTPLVAKSVERIGGEVIAGDELVCNVTGSQTEVGTGVNTFEYTLSRLVGGEDATADYIVTKVEGTLTVSQGIIWIRDTEYKPEEEPRDYGDTGVDDVEKDYDGLGTNITVEVTVPAAGATVTFATNKNSAVWVEDIAFTNAGNHTVYFRVEAHGYGTVTNFARVIIHPLPAAVTAQDKTGFVGDGEPLPYAAAVTGLREEDLPHASELISYTLSCPDFKDEEGTYAIVASGAKLQGNYEVSFTNATLTMATKPAIAENWIVDHADAGDGYVYIACQVVLTKGELTADFVRTLTAEGVIGSSKDGLRGGGDLYPVEIIEDQLDLGQGRIWVRAPLPTEDVLENEGQFLGKIRFDVK